MSFYPPVYVKSRFHSDKVINPLECGNSMFRKDGKREAAPSRPHAFGHGGVGALAPLSRWVAETLSYNDADDEARRSAARKH